MARRLGGDLVVDTTIGEFAEFTMHLPAVTEAELAEGDGTAQDMADIVERMSAQT